MADDKPTDYPEERRMRIVQLPSSEISPTFLVSSNTIAIVNDTSERTDGNGFNSIDPQHCTSLIYHPRRRINIPRDEQLPATENISGNGCQISDPSETKN